MVHSPEELGSLREAIMEVREQVFGKPETLRFIKDIEEYWRLAAQRIVESGLCQPQTATMLHVFVDGLPNADDIQGDIAMVEKTVADLIAQGTIPAYAIIAELQKAGATIHGTENMALLLAEVAYWKAIATQERTKDPKFQQESLENRDEAIITRVNDVVPDGETAIIFIGRAHKVVDQLADDFDINNL